eukprot:scaffold90540_cov69-Phaeocystis_antarctica.AAC.1
MHPVVRDGDREAGVPPAAIHVGQVPQAPRRARRRCGSGPALHVRERGEELARDRALHRADCGVARTKGERRSAGRGSWPGGGMCVWADRDVVGRLRAVAATAPAVTLGVACVALFLPPCAVMHAPADGHAAEEEARARLAREEWANRLAVLPHTLEVLLRRQRGGAGAGFGWGGRTGGWAAGRG